MSKDFLLKNERFSNRNRGYPNIVETRLTCVVSREVTTTGNTYPYGFGNGGKYDWEVYRLDLLVLDVERSQEELRHVDRFGVGCLTLDLGHDGLEEQFPHDPRLDSFVEGARSHFHLEPR